MIRIFLTGDNHIGIKYASHEKAALLVEARISAFEAMVDTANLEQCDLFIITGDLFENTYCTTKKVMMRLLDMLAQFKGTVIILPGNHDYYDKDVKVWQLFKSLQQDYDNVMLLTEYHPYSLTINDSSVMLYPSLCTSMHSRPGENNLGWIMEENIVPDSVYRIGIAHGAVEGETIDKEGHYFLMTRKELESIPVDVWLIGHTHVPFPANLQQDSFTKGEKIFNAGTHVQTDVSCNTEGLCFVIEINEEKTVQAKKVVSGNLRFFRKNVIVTAGSMEKNIQEAVANISNNSVVNLVISGAVSPQEYDTKDEIIENALARFVEGTYTDDGLSRLISKDLIESEFAETSFSAGLLTVLLDEPREAQLTYELLKTLKEEH